METQHEYESGMIKGRLKAVLEEKKEALDKGLSLEHRNNSTLAMYYRLLKAQKFETMEDLDEIVSDLNLRDFVIPEAIQDIKECYSIIFTPEQMKKFFKMYTVTAYTINRFGLDTESAGRLHENVCDFFLGLPSIEYGHQLTDTELSVFHMHIKEMAKSWGFEIEDE